MSSKSICIVLKYTVSKLTRFLRHSVVANKVYILLITFFGERYNQRVHGTILSSVNMEFNVFFIQH